MISLIASLVRPAVPDRAKTDTTLARLWPQTELPFARAAHRNGDAAVILAAGYPQTGALKVLLDRGADAEAKDNNHETALREAARSGKAGSISLLLARATFATEEESR
jgi:hypothetical protein